MKKPFISDMRILIAISLLIFASIIVFTAKSLPNQNNKIVPTPSVYQESKNRLTIKQFFPPVSSTWQLVFNYYVPKKMLALSDIQVINDEVLTDSRETKFSVYKLQVLDNKKKPIYITKIKIQEHLFDEYGNVIPDIDQVTSTVYIPYVSNGKYIQILKGGDQVLEKSI